ncbi:hypothetical protein BLX24_07960 [Arsenicibacter rosenii]|uniref:HTH LytTR-type domain-containing protein n=2 Tax=Arsenicibacter rosenii TaxID=1750698 RepID=A0A1S2VLZ6_9BACT|nr:hypothetical protein BLX24_07960 [Arsenicibacter rosenii]
MEGDINYSWVYLTDGTRLVQGKCLKMMQQAVPGFIRIHKSHLVNPQFIHRCMVPRGREGEIIMRSGLTLPVAKRRGKELLETWEGVAA